MNATEKKSAKSMLALAEAMQADLLTLSKAVHDELKEEFKAEIKAQVIACVKAEVKELFAKIDKSIGERTRGIGDQLEQRARAIGEEVARAVKNIQPPQIVIPENAIKVIMEKSIVNFNPTVNVPKAPAPVVNVEQPTLNPVIRFEAPRKMVTKKHIQYEGNRPSLITEEIIEDPDQE